MYALMELRAHDVQTNACLVVFLGRTLYVFHDLPIIKLELTRAAPLVVIMTGLKIQCKYPDHSDRFLVRRHQFPHALVVQSDA